MKGGRLSKVRTDLRAVGLKRSTHAVVASASENAIDLGAQSIGKNTTGRNNRPRLTASRIAKLLEDGPRFQPKLLRTGRSMPRLFIWKTQRLRSKPGPFFRNIPDISIVALQTIFPKYSGYFDDSIFRNIWNISGKWSPKYSFGKMVPEIFGIFRENGGWLRFPDRFAFPEYLEYLGNWSLQKIKPLCLPHICRGSPGFGQAVRRRYEAVTSSRGSPDQFSEISGIFRESGPGKRAQVRRASFTVSFYRVKI